MKCFEHYKKCIDWKARVSYGCEIFIFGICTFIHDVLENMKVYIFNRFSQKNDFVCEILMAT